MILWLFLVIILSHGNGQIPLGMPQFALRAVRAKASQVEGTHGIPQMLISAVRAMLTKASPIPHTFPPLGIRIHMLIYTLSIRTLPILCEEPAFRHLFQIIFVQEFTDFAFFAQAAEPVFANDAFFCADMFIGAVVATEADAFLEIFTYIGDYGVPVLWPTVINSHVLPDESLKVKFPTSFCYSHFSQTVESNSPRWCCFYYIYKSKYETNVKEK